MSLSIQTPNGRVVVAGLYDSKSTTQASQIYYDNKDTKIKVSNMQKALDYVLLNNSANSEFDKGWFDRPLEDLEWSKADKEDFFRTNFNSIKDHLTNTISDINVNDFVTFYITYETDRVDGTEEITRSFRDFIYENMCLSEDKTELRFTQELVHIINDFVIDYQTNNPKNFYYHYMYPASTNSGKNFMNTTDYNLYKDFINSLDKEKYPFVIFRYYRTNTTPTVVEDDITYSYRASVIIPKDEYVNTFDQGFYVNSSSTSTTDLDEVAGNTSANTCYYSFDGKAYSSTYTYYDEYFFTYGDNAKIIKNPDENMKSTSSQWAFRNLANIIVKDYSSTTSITFLTLKDEREVVKVYKSVPELMSAISNDALKVYGFIKPTDTYDKNVYTISKEKILNGNDNYSIITKIQHKPLNGDEIQTIVDDLLEKDAYQVPNKEIKPDVYSEEETRIGTYLGKPLYRKVIFLTSTGTGEHRLPYDLSFVSKMVKIDAMADGYIGSNYANPNIFSNWGFGFSDWNVNGFNIFKGAKYGALPIRFIIEYTRVES